MNESRGETLTRIAFDDSLTGLDKEDARRELRTANSWEASLERRRLAADSLIKIARKNRLDALASAAEEAWDPDVRGS